MPEGDTIYRLARRMHDRLSGRLVIASDFRVPALATRDLTGATVTETTSIGKHLLTRLDGPTTGPVTLHTHLRMDGSWSILTPGKTLPRRLDPDVRLRLDLTGPAHKQPPITAFGLRLPVVQLLPTQDESLAVGHLGPDPLRPGWNPDRAVERLMSDPARPVIAALLDQTRIAGLGNLWANETCFLRGISPWTPVGDLGPSGLAGLVGLAARMLRYSVTNPRAAQVTTGDLRRGRQHWVAGRAGQPCLRCRTLIRVVAEVPGDPGRRRTWWCPHCQPGPEPEINR